MDRSIDLVVCDFHTAWQVFVQAIVAPLTSPLLPFHPKAFLFRLFLIVFLCFLPCCFVLCPRPSFFCLMPFCANMGKPKTNITAAMRNLLSGVLHQPYQLHLVALFCVFHSLFLRRFFFAVDALCIFSFSVFVSFALLLSSPVLCLSLGKNRSKKDHPNRDLHPSSKQYALKI